MEIRGRKTHKPLSGIETISPFPYIDPGREAARAVSSYCHILFRQFDIKFVNNTAF